MLNSATKINSDKTYPFIFSICTLVNDVAEYQEMLESYEQCGFTNEICEFLYSDNSVSNQYDLFQAYNQMIHHASGQYIILCHQDIIIKDNSEKLQDRLNALTQFDSNWGLAGNAGVKMNNGKVALYIHDHVGERITETHYPIQSQCLDGNFMVVKSSAMLALSHDMNGFHFYDLDICLQAKYRGYTMYVIDFMLYHKSPGKKNQLFYDNRAKIEALYAQKLQQDLYRTTCTKAIISGSQWHQYKRKLQRFISTSLLNFRQFYRRLLK